MKNLRQLLVVAVLTCAFALPVCAGEISAGIADPPPPPPQGATANGQIECGLTESVLAALQGVLAVL